MIDETMQSIRKVQHSRERLLLIWFSFLLVIFVTIVYVAPFAGGSLYDQLFTKEESHAAGEDATITIDFDSVEMVSDLEVGVTFMQKTFSGQAANVAKEKELMALGVKYMNQHIMSFGAANPWPDPGVEDPFVEEPTTEPRNWTNLDRRLQHINDMGGTPVITLCCAPDWMKVRDFKRSTYDYTNFTNWSINEYAPIMDPDPIIDKQDDFARLTAIIAQRYDGTHYDSNGRLLPRVDHFLMWNEMKHMWEDPVRYTSLYNKMWDAIKAVRPEVKLGGPYMIVEGSGTRHFPSVTPAYYNANPIVREQRDLLNYWFMNKRGADFVAIDKSVVYKPSADPMAPYYTEDQKLSLTPLFASVVNQVKDKSIFPGYNGEPIWFAEDYVAAEGTANPPAATDYVPLPLDGRNGGYQPVALASMLYHELKSGVSVSLRWAPEDEEGPLGQYLFTHTRQANGGQPNMSYSVYRAYHEHFKKGTTIYSVNSTDANIEVLASAEKILLLNKNPHLVTLAVGRARGGDTQVNIEKYGVLLMDVADIPASPTVTPIVGMGTPQATVMPLMSCLSEGTTSDAVVEITWPTSTPAVRTVDISTSATNWSSRSNKSVVGELSTVAPEGFGHYSTRVPLIIEPDMIYYVRLYDGTSVSTEPYTSFMIPLCAEMAAPIVEANTALESYGNSSEVSGNKETDTAVWINGQEVVARNSSRTWSYTHHWGTDEYGEKELRIKVVRGGSESPEISVMVKRYGLGDITGDGVVDVFDLGVFASNYNKGGITGSDSKNVRLSDLNQDGEVDVFDLGMIASRYNMDYGY